jgi:hypothetical protein
VLLVLLHQEPELPELLHQVLELLLVLLVPELLQEPELLHQEPEQPALLLLEPVLHLSLRNPKKLILRKQQVMLLLD